MTTNKKSKLPKKMAKKLSRKPTPEALPQDKVAEQQDALPNPLGYDEPLVEAEPEKHGNAFTRFFTGSDEGDS